MSPAEGAPTPQLGKDRDTHARTHAHMHTHTHTGSHYVKGDNGKLNLGAGVMKAQIAASYFDEVITFFTIINLNGM